MCTTLGHFTPFLVGPVADLGFPRAWQRGGCQFRTKVRQPGNARNWAKGAYEEWVGNLVISSIPVASIGQCE